MKLKDYKKYPKVCCIYEICNIITKKRYIGSCIDLHARMVRHMWYLKHNMHHSLKLQRSFNKHTIDAFEVNIIDTILLSDNLEILEESLIKKYNTVENGYNSVYNTKHYHKGNKPTKEQIQKRIKHCQKSVICINRFTGDIENEFESITKTGKFYNTSTSNISQVCKHNANYIKDTIFRYSSDYSGEKIVFLNNHNRGIAKSEKTKHLMIIGNPNTNPVYQYDLEMNFIKEYLSRNQCIKQTLYGDYQIRQAIKNKTSLNGYYFIQKNKI